MEITKIIFILGIMRQFLFKSVKIRKTSNFGGLIDKEVLINGLSIEKELFTQSFNIEKPKNEDINVIKSVFINCSTSSSNGGGINCQIRESYCFVNKCAFVNCFSAFSGGGIFSICEKTSLKQTCFMNDSAFKSGQSIETQNSATDLNQVLIFSCGPQTKSSRKTSSFLKGNVFIRNTNVSESRQVDEECVVSIVDCGSINFRLNNIEKNEGEGVLFISCEDEISTFEQCNIVNNTSNDVNIAAFNFSAPKMTLRKFIFIGNSFSTYFSSERNIPIVLHECKFDTNANVVGLDSVVMQKSCNFDAAKVNLNQITTLLTKNCFILNSTESLPTSKPTLVVSIKRTQKIISELIKESENDEGEIIWMPKGMFFVQYWLIIYASIITPIFIIIHCIKTRSVRRIKALN